MVGVLHLYIIYGFLEPCTYTPLPEDSPISVYTNDNLGTTAIYGVCPLKYEGTRSIWDVLQEHQYYCYYDKLCQAAMQAVNNLAAEKGCTAHWQVAMGGEFELIIFDEDETDVEIPDVKTLTMKSERSTLQRVGRHLRRFW